MKEKEIIKRRFRKIFHPDIRIVIACILCSVAGLIWVFVYQHTDTWFAYFMYLFSAYSLVISVLCTGRLLNGLLVRLLPHVPLLNRLVNDVYFRTRFFLYLSFTINVFYAMIYLVPGIHKRSIWNISVAMTYILLAISRFRLSKYSFHHRNKEQNVREELCMYVQTGWLILVLDILISGMSVLMIVKNEGWEQSPIIVIAIAAYTFYMLGLSIYGVIHCRIYHSPVMLAIRNISLAATLFSFLPLTSEMLQAFGQKNEENLMDTLLAVTGAVLFTAVLILGLTAIVSGKQKLKTKQ